MTHPIIKDEEPLLITVTEDQEKQRIDQFLHIQLPAYSRSFFHRLIEDGLIKSNNKLVTKAGHIIKPHDLIQIDFPSKQPVTAQMLKAAQLPIEILYEHEHFMIINKPAGLLVHAANSTKTEISLVDWITHHIENIKHVGQIDRPGIVHRLDKLTSGLMIIPRTNYAYQQFNKLFHDRAIEKIYYAIVKGHPPKSSTIDLPIGRHPVERTKMSTFDPHRSTHTKVRHAITHYEVEQYFEDAALLRVSLETGRTHQIRVHLAAIGHPIVGDVVYGTASPFINRQALHAQRLQFTFDNELFTFESKLPQDMENFLKQLKPIVD